MNLRKLFMAIVRGERLPERVPHEEEAPLGGIWGLHEADASFILSEWRARKYGAPWPGAGPDGNEPEKAPAKKRRLTKKERLEKRLAELQGEVKELEGRK